MIIVRFSLRDILFWLAIVGCLLASVKAAIWPRTGLLQPLLNIWVLRDTPGLLDAAAFAVLACALSWWMHRDPLSTFWTASLISYGLADTVCFAVAIRSDLRGWNQFWPSFMAIVVAAAFGTVMGLVWFIRSFLQRRRAAETFQQGRKGWIARALALVCLAIIPVLGVFTVLLFSGSIDPTH